MIETQAKAIKQSLGQQTQQAQEPKQIDENTAIKFLQQAGGDKEKARKLASEQGYKF